jgi:hypothetical protein
VLDSSAHVCLTFADGSADRSLGLVLEEPSSNNELIFGRKSIDHHPHTLTLIFDRDDFSEVRGTILDQIPIAIGRNSDLSFVIKGALDRSVDRLFGEVDPTVVVSLGPTLQSLLRLCQSDRMDLVEPVGSSPRPGGVSKPRLSTHVIVQRIAGWNKTPEALDENRPISSERTLGRFSSKIRTSIDQGDLPNNWMRTIRSLCSSRFATRDDRRFSHDVRRALRLQSSGGVI